jgi:hypothetical protein
MTAPAIGGAAVVLAVAVVWLFQPAPQVARDLDVDPEPVAQSAPVAVARTAMPAVEPAAPPTAGSEPAASAPSTAERSPLPGERPTTPMADLVAERQNMIQRAGPGVPGDRRLPENIAAVELEFGAEPVDRTWAPSAEAAVFAAFAAIPGLKLIDSQVECRSTMCRVQLTQPGSAVTNGERAPFNILRDSIGLTPRWMMMSGAGTTSLRSVGYFWREGFAPSEQPDQPHRSN